MEESLPSYFLPRDNFQALIDTIMSEGYRCIGPQVKHGTILYDTLSDVEQLPQGYQDEQQPGQYRLNINQSNHRFFSWANGPQAIKPHTFASRESLWRASRDETGKLTFEQCQPPQEKIAIIGVRGCDLAGYQLQKQHFCKDDVVDEHFATRSANLLLVAVDCTHPADTCFCASTGDGPDIKQGSDIHLSEIESGFICRAKSEAGAQLITNLDDRFNLSQASDEQLDETQRATDSASEQQRQIAPQIARDKLANSLKSGVWQKVAEQCLSCGNCTSVCPSCFCYREVDESSLEGHTSEHKREWDSCFTEHHSYLHGQPLHLDTASRYRQWLTHKFSNWYEQYGRSGCTGCGRCITWCPVGIDVTEVLNQLCQTSIDQNPEESSENG